MKRMPFVSLMALTIASVFLMPDGSASLALAAPAATATPTPKDPCGDTKSKWAHFQCQQFNASAPGDEYFGRTKISYLGIDNTFKDGSISAGGYTTDPRLIGKLMAADEALTRWAAKYPSDPQLARSYFLGIQVFRKVYTQPGQETAWRYVQILITKFPKSYFGKNIKASLANGFTEHWFALPQICPTPLPKGVMPEKTPSATPTPSPSPGQPAIDIIVPPCVQPSPSPTPESMASSSPPPKGHAPAPSPSAMPSRPQPLPALPSGAQPLPTLVPGPSPRPPLLP
jgi:hypothetical protein